MAAAPPAPPAAADPDLAPKLAAIKGVMTDQFNDLNRRQKIELLKQVLTAVESGGLISGLKTAVQPGKVELPGVATKRIETFLEPATTTNTIVGGRRRKASRKSQRKSRKASRKSQRKSRKASRK